MTLRKQGESKNRSELVSRRFESIDRGKDVYVLCDEGVLGSICTTMIASGYGISQCRGYDPTRDKTKYDWYIKFTSGIDKGFTIDIVRLSEELEKYEKRMQPVREEIHLFKEKLKCKATETLKSTKAEKCDQQKTS